MIDTTLEGIEALWSEDAPPNDAAGTLAAVARALRPLRPSLVLLADRNGRILAIQREAAGEDVGPLDDLAASLAARLAETDRAVFDWGGEGAAAWAFGVRLGGAQRAILGGWLRGAERRQDTIGVFEQLREVLGICGELAHGAVLAAAREESLTTRIRHLLAERDTLKASHAEAIAASLEERDQRRREHELAASLEGFCKALESANRARNRFLANISQQLRDPVLGVLGSACLGARKAGTMDRDCLRREFESIQARGETVLAMINNLIELAGLELGETDFDFARLDLRQLVASAVEQFRSEVPGRPVHVAAPDEAFDGAMVGDAVKLELVLFHLLGNAARFSPPHSPIHISLEGDATRVRLAVADQGPGIPAADLETIFDQFAPRGPRGETGVGAGVGLALAICREIVSAHAGRIWADNPPDGGRRFVCELPRDPRDTSLWAAAAAAVPRQYAEPSPDIAAAFG